MRSPRHVIGLFLLCSVVALDGGLRAYPTIFPFGVTIHEPGVSEGYIVFAAPDAGVHVVDVNGNVVHEWFPIGGTSGPSRPLPGGHFMTFNRLFAREYDWDGNIVWEFASPFPGVEWHHDLDRLPNGNTMILCNVASVVPTISPLTLVEDCLIEVTQTGEVVFEWFMTDHFDELGFTQAEKDNIFERGFDWSHTNAAAVIPQNTSHTDPRFSPGNIILSIRLIRIRSPSSTARPAPSSTRRITRSSRPTTRT